MLDGGKGMTWNYRVISHGGWFGIHEVHYDKHGKPYLWTERPILRAETLEKLLNFTGTYEIAPNGKLKQPVLDEAEMPGGE